MTAILGLNAYHGDAAAALVVDGELVCAAEEERFNRVKHCAGFPAQAAAWCLAEGGLSAGDLEHVAIGRDPRANLGAKVLRTLLKGTSPSYVKARLQNASRVRDVKGELESALGAEVGAELHLVEHHQAHVASAFFVSPFEDAAVLTLDGFGDFASTMLAEGHGSSFKVLDRVLFPHSLGIFYTAVTQWLGFPSYGDEGKVMGLAPYGTPRFLEEMRSVVQEKGDLFELGLDFFRHHKEGVDMTWDEGTPSIGRIFSERMEEVFGPAREPGEPLTSLHEDVAASLQARLEEVYLHLVSRLAARTGSPNICLAGGVALNAVANGRIRPETPFEEVFVQPAAGDSGIAVGAAFHVWHQGLGRPRGFAMEHAYWGPAYDDAECAAALAAAGLEAERLDDDELVARVAERIADGDVVGWFQGRMEYGPARARQPLDRRRPAPGRHEGHPQRSDQAPGAVPAVRPVDPRGAGRRVVRAGLHLALHGARLQDAGREARADPGGQPRRRHRARADGDARGERAVPPADRGVRPPDRRPDPAEHLVQRERADRDEPRAGDRHVPEDEDGPARARELGR